MGTRKAKANRADNSSGQKAVTEPMEGETPSREAIARRAYEIWEQNGYPGEQELAHWLQAEYELANGGPGT